MKTIAAVALLSAVLANSQTVNISITGVSPTVIADIRTHWLDQAGAPCAATTSPIDATSYTVTVSLSQASLTSQQALPLVGQSVVLEGEPMIVSAITGGAVSLQRGTLPGATLSAHPVGASVAILKYATPWEMANAEALRTWIQNVVAQLGSRSLTFGGVATGTVTQ